MTYLSSRRGPEIELLENTLKKEIVELKSKISTLKSQLYQAKKDIRDKEN